MRRAEATRVTVSHAGDLTHSRKEISRVVPGPGPTTMLHTELHIRTGDVLVSDLTDPVRDFVRDQRDGLCSVFVPHATAGVGLMETGSGSEQDLATVLGRLLPRDSGYRHAHGSPGHGADHVLPVFVSPSLTIPVYGGSLGLGTWQSVVLIDSNRDNRDRRVLLDFLTG
jgi:secondary thiamine-phosphate synthase enzyme